MEICLRYDLSRSPGSVPVHELYQACLEQAAYADRAGLDVIRLHEHHGRDDDYLPSPAVLGAAIAARTQRIAIRFSILVLGLHHPVRIAEDIAVLDQLAQGRVQLSVAAGYRRSEFTAFGLALEDRVRLLREKLPVLRQAWTGEPFEYDGAPVLVRPRPHRDRQIPIYLGGSSPLSARLAAELADGYEPARASLKDDYRAACARLGKAPGWTHGPEHSPLLVHLAEDPDRAWARIAPYVLHDSRQYARDGASASVDDIAHLRGPGAYHVLTPDEAVELMVRLGPDGAVTSFAPLLGGMDPDLGWESLHLLVDDVLPRLEAAGLRTPPTTEGSP